MGPAASGVGSQGRVAVAMRPTLGWAAVVVFAFVGAVTLASGSPASATTVAVAPTSLDWGSARVTNSTPLQFATLTNSGSGALSVGQSMITGPNAGDFILYAAEDGCSNRTVAASGGTCRIGLYMIPQGIGPRSATLSIPTSQGSPQTVALSGTGLSAVEVGPTTLDWGSARVTNSTSLQFVTLTNNQAVWPPLNIGQATISGPNAGDFIVYSAEDGCSNRTVAGAGGTCRIGVYMVPQGIGPRSATLTIPSNAVQGSLQTVALSGTGLSAVEVGPTSLDWGSARVTNSTPLQFVTLTNNQAVWPPLNIGQATLTGPNAGDFVVYSADDGCSNRTVAGAGGTCRIGVYMIPQGIGPRSATLTIPSNAVQGSLQTVALSGTGLSAVEVGPTSLDFGTNLVSRPTTLQTVTLTNNQAVWPPLNIGQATISGPNAGDFIVYSAEDTCSNRTVAGAGATCRIAVYMIAGGVGPRSATLSIPSNAVQGSLQTVALSGIGASDVTPPETSAVSDPAPGPAGWNQADVTVTLSAVDNQGGSGVRTVTYSSSGAQTTGTTVVNGASARVVVTTEGSTTITFFATDNAGNAEAAKTVVVNLDKTAPQVACGAPDGAWHPDDVAIGCTASDAGSGLANAGDATFSLSTSVPAGTETANASTGTRSVCDVAGHCATAGPVGGIMVDRKAPTVTITSPTNTDYTLNQVVAASYTCTDGGSGVASCGGPVASGANLATGAPGPQTFAVAAADNVGNSATASVDYRVTYRICVLFDQTKAHQRNSTVPVRLRLCDAAGANLSSSSINVTALGVTKKDDTASAVAEDSGNANPDSNFRYDPGLGGYVYNLSAKPLSTGTWVLEFAVAGDPVTHTVQFDVR